MPPWLDLMQKLRDTGIHAEHDSAVIMSWPGAIAAKYPEMTGYAGGYVHDTVPWCGLTVAYVMTESGIRPQFGAADTDRFLWADAWRQFGIKVAELDTATGELVFAPGMSPLPGDVCVFRWPGGGHHVTLYDHEVDDNSYHCTGGNQGSGHVVSTEAMPMANCIAIRRPPASVPPQPQPQEPTMDFTILLKILTSLPTLVDAFKTILQSDAAHTIESAFQSFVNHNTAGKPNAPALGPTAPPAPKG